MTMNDGSTATVRLRSIYAAYIPDDAKAQSGSATVNAPAAANEVAPPAAGDPDGRTPRDGGDGRAVVRVDPLKLPQSTHTLLFTQPPCSFPFFFSVGIAALSYVCLVLVQRDKLEVAHVFRLLKDEHARFIGQWDAEVPANVSAEVRAAQYLAVFVALLIEEEIPTGLHLLRLIQRASFERRFPDKKYARFVLSCVVRIVMGYLFLFNVLIVLILSTGVIDIFYDCLALQFVQQLDDFAFSLAKRDVFGKQMQRACTEKCFQTEFEKERFGRSKRMSIFLKAIYFFNLLWLLVIMGIYTTQQVNGDLQCKSITVDFGDEVWQEALVKMPREQYDRWVVLHPLFKEVVSPDRYERWTLVFSYFNGFYERNGTHAGRPVYRERRKFDRTPYGQNLRFEYVVPAEIRYCEEISAWVFTHPFIHKKKEDSGCNWLLRSQETEEFNLKNVDNNWQIWNGVIQETKLSYTCNECDDASDCNMNGKCIDGQCECNKEDDAEYLGTHCEVKLKDSCRTIIGETSNVTFSVWNYDQIPDGHWRNKVHQQYSRPAYALVGGMPDFAEGDICGLGYTGSRWFGYWYSLEDLNWTWELWFINIYESHAFWGREYDPMLTSFVSDPTKKDTPAGVDFYWIEEHGDGSGQFGPFGALIPFQKHNLTGRGFFRCAGEYIPPPPVLQIPKQIGSQRLLKP